MWDMLLLFWRSCSCLQFSITLSPFCSISMSWAKLVHSGIYLGRGNDRIPYCRQQDVDEKCRTIHKLELRDSKWVDVFGSRFAREFLRVDDVELGQEEVRVIFGLFLRVLEMQR
ncbi:hypothetical protein KC19_1G151800 [Ceratodon purpureus]|uniref:Uncharacterized protein n=1 Tax=Ceratodon purpureus TaxID=3225 RepID=A0A8T0J7C7_CERPU|nr:hypothetical protein KC19_1G151800 [Ceratodon purpureus]